jgi:hypothetical protein
VRKPGMSAIGRLLPPLTKRAFAQRGLHEAAIVTDWPAIVGDALARCSAPERLKPDGTLAVRVAHAPAALELQHLEPVVLDRMATYLGFRAARRLALRQGPLPARPEPARPRPGAPLTGPALGAVDAVEDQALRAALARLGAAVAADEDG